LRYPGDATLGFVITIGGAAGQPGEANGLAEVSRFSDPTAVAADPRGRLYIADTGNHRIRKMESVPGYTGYYGTATLAGSGAGSDDGPLATARFRSPAGVAVDGEETIYVADTGNHTIRKISGGVVTTIAGLAGSPGAADGHGSHARFTSPTAIAVDARGNLYVCDPGNHAIRKVAPSGFVTTVIAPGILSSPSGIAIDASGAIYIADSGNHRVRVASVARPRRRAVR
jgi:sugar lactone lactonase YvrE